MGQARAACVGPPYEQFDFWLGEWHGPSALAAEHYAVRRTAGGCAVEEVLIGGNGQIQGIGVSGWDSGRKQWRQLWADKESIVTFIWAVRRRTRLEKHSVFQGMCSLLGKCSWS
jgi:hypothetical protein